MPAERDERPPRNRLARILRWLLAAVAWLYLTGTLGYLVAQRLVGERWWLTTVVLYLPHVVALAPAALLLLLLVVIGPRKLAVLPLVATALLLFPIMGLVVLGGAAAPHGGPRLRLLSYNVNSGRGTAGALAAQILEAAPDIVAMQEGGVEVGEQIAARLPGFARHADGEFYLLSRWPIIDVFAPPKIVIDGIGHMPRFMRYTLATPLGPIELFSIHPKSPREGFEEIRGNGLAHEVESGGVLSFDRHAMIGNTELRRLEVEAAVAAARGARYPVIFAGDTNLPHGSSIFAANLARYQDGFAAVGRGFGYTFPANLRFAWMRIDRILAGPGLRFLEFHVGTRHASDHYCVWADLERG